ncbi:hypothetical protein CEXT_674391 [Caerostris extrusa]|uniref:Uncharacterized protein n=1 Tax=Caerostris extrusa TaxID=172846 RepID=A0AAV4QWL4_CAEEX|nr:hypothetical protein CEXT_674391 [Caerostris extrusa]
MRTIQVRLRELNSNMPRCSAAASKFCMKTTFFNITPQVLHKWDVNQKRGNLQSALQLSVNNSDLPCDGIRAAQRHFIINAKSLGQH